MKLLFMKDVVYYDHIRLLRRGTVGGLKGKSRMHHH